MAYVPPFATSKVIELGGGHAPLFRPNVDARPGPATDFTADFERALPIQSAEWDGVFSKFALEHLSWRSFVDAPTPERPGFLREVFRILKPGGLFVCVTANGEAQMRWALARGDWDERISQCLAGDQDYSDNTHKVFFNPSWLARLLADAGFVQVIVLPFGELRTDLIVEAKKGA